MKYDLKGLKGAADARIPEIPLDERILDRALDRGAKRNDLWLTRVLTAMAACVIILAVMNVLIVPGLETKPDDTGDGDHLLSQGVHPQTASSEEAQSAAEEDLSVYQVYSPDFAYSMMPDEMVFGDVVIRRLDNYEKTFVFEDEESGERVVPGQFDMAYAWFPATETGLVRLGPNEGMSLVNVLREVLDGQYSYFEYKGDGVAVVANRDEDETQPDSMYLISTEDGSRLSRDYESIGTMYSGDVRLMMGHDDRDHLGDYDVLAMDGRVIARVSELCGVYFGEWLMVQLPGEEKYCLIDYEGTVQLNGMRFSRIAYERDDMMIVWTEEGNGVIRRDGSWVFEPGRYFMIEFAGDGLFRAVEPETGETVQINEKGERVETLRFRVDQLIDCIGEKYVDWKDSFGKLGFAVIWLTVFWLILRIGWSKQNGELQHMLMTELGMAAYIVGLILIGHRLGGEDVILWPTDTSTEGARAMAGQWIFLSYALTASLIAAYPKLRSPKKAFLAGYALMLLPWTWRAVCGDVSVAGWRTFSEVVFAGGALLAILLFWVKPVSRFMDWCARFDSLNEYGRWIRIVWAGLIVTALVNFGAGCFASAQEIEKFTYDLDYACGLTETQNEEWFEEVNYLSAEYRESGWDDDCLDLKKYDYSVISAVRWLRENELSELTEDMVYSIWMMGEFSLRRSAGIQLILEAEQGANPNVWQIVMHTPLSDADETVQGSAVFLVPPGDILPDIEARLYIRQQIDLDDFIAAQRYYRAEIGTVLDDEYGTEWIRSLKGSNQKETEKQADGY